MTASSIDKSSPQNPSADVNTSSGLVAAMRERTHALHTEAERSGIINDIMRGRASRHSYAILLRNLLPAYETLELGLDKFESAPSVGGAARREVYRAPALRSDLRALAGDTWETTLPLLPEGEQYAGRVAAAAQGHGGRLLAHAYTRYLGDLSGGLIMKRMLAKVLQLEPAELSFYEFPGIPDPQDFKRDYLAAIDRAAEHIADVDGVIDEAMAAFELNIAVSTAVQRTVEPV